MRVCSLFSGIGGIDLGFIQAVFEVVWANEIDENSRRHYEGDERWILIKLKRLYLY